MNHGYDRKSSISINNSVAAGRNIWRAETLVSYAARGYGHCSMVVLGVYNQAVYLSGLCYEHATNQREYHRQGPIAESTLDLQ